MICFPCLSHDSHLFTVHVKVLPFLPSMSFLCFVGLFPRDFLNFSFLFVCQNSFVIYISLYYLFISPHLMSITFLSCCQKFCSMKELADSRTLSEARPQVPSLVNLATLFRLNKQIHGPLNPRKTDQTATSPHGNNSPTGAEHLGHFYPRFGPASMPIRPT